MGGDKEFVFNGHRVSLWEDVKVVEVGGGGVTQTIV